MGIYPFFTNESRDGPLCSLRCNGCGNSIVLVWSTASNSTALWILMQQHSTLSHFDLNIYCANARQQAIPDDTTKLRKTSDNLIININTLNL